MRRKPFSWPFYYGWVIVGIAFLSMGVWLAMRATFSVFLVVLLDEFHWSRASAAGVQSLSFVVYTCSAPVVGMLIDRFGPRRIVLPGIILLCGGLLLSATVQTLFQFYLFYGVIAACGVTFVSISAYSAILAHWFEARRGLASGIAVSGMGIGAFALVPLIQYAIDTEGWRFAFMVLAGLVFLLLFPVTAVFLRHKPSELGLRPDGASWGTAPKIGPVEVIDPRWAETDWTLKRASREGRFWSLLGMGFLSIIPFYLILIHGAKLLVDRGFSGMGAAFIIAFVGINSSVFKVFWGWLSDRIGREITFTAGVGATVLGIVFLLLFEAGGSRQTAYLFALFLGCGWGVMAPIYMSASADLFQGKSYGLIYGVLESVIGLGSALGPWLGGFVFDATGSYGTAFLIAIAACLMSCPFLWIAAPRKVRRRIPAGGR